ncbi:MAG: hypothetical protein OEU26_35520 [Candidatus Tectomicrobia bacterium]|nr:hypothetical protein [Candidatus Tectomicrobia bacterium]
MQEVRNEEKATRAGGGQAAPQQGRDVMLNVMLGNDAWTGLAGAVEDFDLLLGQESGGQWRGCQPFFFARP